MKGIKEKVQAEELRQSGTAPVERGGEEVPSLGPLETWAKVVVAIIIAAAAIAGAFILASGRIVG